MRIPGDVVDRVLDSWPIARLTTLGPEGAPQPVPIVFVHHGGRIWSPVDAKPKRSAELGRIRNVESDPRVSLLLDHYDANWSRLWWVRIDGRARVVRPSGPDDPEVARVVEALRGKCPPYTTVPVLLEPSRLIAIDPGGVTTWCAGPEALRAI